MVKPAMWATGIPVTHPRWRSRSGARAGPSKYVLVPQAVEALYLIGNPATTGPAAAGAPGGVPENRPIPSPSSARQTWIFVFDTNHLLPGAGFGRAKLTNAVLEKQLGTVATTRNWKTVLKLLELSTA